MWRRAGVRAFKMARARRPPRQAPGHRLTSRDGRLESNNAKNYGSDAAHLLGWPYSPKIHPRRRKFAARPGRALRAGREVFADGRDYAYRLGRREAGGSLFRRRYYVRHCCVASLRGVEGICLPSLGSATARAAFPRSLDFRIRPFGAYGEFERRGVETSKEEQEARRR